jgi:ATP-dependent Lon protease
MFTALLSLLTGRPARHDLAMTGEITLRGRVLPIGGVREKVLAAHRAGLKVILMPEKNLKDLVDVPKKVRDELKIIPIQHMDQVLDIAMGPQAVIEPPRPRRRQEEQSQDQEEE